MSEAIELDDFKEDLKIINEKLDMLTKQLDEEKELKTMRKFSPEKVMATRDIRSIFMHNDKNDSWFINEWKIMTKEEKQEFTAKYIESLTFEKDNKYPNGIKLVDIKLKSLFAEKINKLSEVGLSQIPIEFIANGKSVLIDVNHPIKESQLKKYLDEIKSSNAIKFHMHPTFNYKLEDMPEEIDFDLEDNEKILKLIPIVKDIDNPDNLSNKFRLGIVTSFVKTTKEVSKE